MISPRFYFSVFLLSAFLITTCAQVDSKNSITVEQLRDEIKANDNLIVLDVRTPVELKGPLGYINGAINIPVQELKSRINELEEFKENDIAVICRSGNRSVAATNILLENGFSAKNVFGGMKEYRKNK
jgi:rhodanese-related sulfurtransferase